MKKATSRLKSIFRLKSKHTGRDALDTNADSELGVGAILPPELFPRVLHFVSRDDRRAQVLEEFNRAGSRKVSTKDLIAELSRHDEEILKAGPLYTLKSCSLVCRYWANQCRRYMFFKSTMHIRSLQKAEQFRYFATQGSEKLVSLCSLISTVAVYQSYSSSRSFADLAYIPETHEKLWRLQLEGPLPDNIPPENLDAPHWGLANPRSVPPLVTSYRYLLLRDVHYPSFSHLSRCLKHFKDTAEFLFIDLSWSGKAIESIIQFDKPTRHPRERIVITAKGCTDDLFICMQTAMIYPDFALRTVPDQDRRWAIQMMRNLYEVYSAVPLSGKPEDKTTYVLDSYFRANNRSYSFSFGVQSLRPDYPRATIHFVCEPKSLRSSTSQATGRKSPEPIRIVGIMVSIFATWQATSPYQLSTIDLTLFRDEIEKHSAARVVVFTFSNYTLLQKLTEQHPTLLQPLANEITFVFACGRTPEQPFPEVSFDDGNGQKRWDGRQSWVGMDPVTLQVTGEQWNYEGHILPTLLQSRQSFLSS